MSMFKQTSKVSLTKMSQRLGYRRVERYGLYLNINLEYWY